MSSTMITRTTTPTTEFLTPTTVALKIYVRSGDAGVQMFRIYGAGTDAMVDYYPGSAHPWEWSGVRTVGQSEALKAQKTLRRKGWQVFDIELAAVVVNGKLDYDPVEAAECVQATIKRRRNHAIKRERQLREMGL